MHEDIDYYGKDFTEEEMERLYLERFISKPVVLQQEASCARRRWHEYGSMSPMRATYLFAYYYNEEYKRHYAKYYDHERGQYVKAFKKEDFNESREANALFRCRRIADLMGCPYWFYIRYALEIVDRFGTGKYIPRPNRLTDQEVIDQVKDKFIEYRLANII